MIKITSLFVLLFVSSLGITPGVCCPGDTVVLSALESQKHYSIPTVNQNKSITLKTVANDSDSFLLKGIDDIKVLELIDLNGRKVFFDVKVTPNGWNITPQNINTKKSNFILLITNSRGDFITKRIDLL